MRWTKSRANKYRRKRIANRETLLRQLKVRLGLIDVVTEAAATAVKAVDAATKKKEKQDRKRRHMERSQARARGCLDGVLAQLADAVATRRHIEPALCGGPVTRKVAAPTEADGASDVAPSAALVGAALVDKVNIEPGATSHPNDPCLNPTTNQLTKHRRPVGMGSL